MLAAAPTVEANGRLWSALRDFGLSGARIAGAPGERLARAGEPVARVFVPIDAVVLIARQTPLDPLPLTVSLIGSEGLVGTAALLATRTWSHDAIVLLGGELAAIEIVALEAAMAAQPALRDLLLRVVHNHMLQLAQSVVANNGHSLERRLARWLIMLDDRTDKPMIRVTHDQLAQLLNVRRASVTDALHVLEGERLIRSVRGHVEVRDRAGLENRCGQSYGLSENDYRAAIGPFGRPAPRPASAEQ